MADPNLDIQPLTPDRLPDLAALFDEGGDPRWCRCAYFHVRGLSWQNSTPASNQALLDARAVGDRPPGLVAYRDARLVGWINVGPREGYERLAYSTVLAPLDERPTWSIVCFVVSRAARRTGVAGALLDAAVAFAAANGARLVEGYPIDADGERVPAASAYHGTLSMFERAGFEVAARRQANRTSRPRPIVRREIRPRRRKPPEPG
jgi:GNAT superfamily N-acetyltransferase